MIVAGRFEIPDKCPKDCPYYGKPEHIGQGGECFRCPVMNCSLCPADPSVGVDEPFRVLDPEDFHAGLAEEWFHFFKELEAKRGPAS